MSRAVDLLIIGAGPAGMSAALRARRLGLSVLVVDDQPAPGGQIWRDVETKVDTGIGKLMGDDYAAGLPLVHAFRASGALYEPGTQVWQIEPGWQVYMSRAQQAECVQAANVLLATGAQERPAPFPGWTLPGVLTVGAAQILLKNARQIPKSPPWIAGGGPLAVGRCGKGNGRDGRSLQRVRYFQEQDRQSQFLLQERQDPLQPRGSSRHIQRADFEVS